MEYKSIAHKMDAGQLLRSSDETGLESLLLVDDNPINLQILFKTLERTGHRLLVAQDGETALELARLNKPSLILLDIVMPDMNGYEVCEQLKSDPETAGIAVIFLSALEDSAAKVKGFSVGGVDYISKPFQADEVVARVRNHIKMQRLERELERRNNELESENQQILNAVSEGIVGLNKDGRVVLFNSAATLITGWSEADSLGEHILNLGLFDVDGSQSIQEHQTLPYRSYRQGLVGRSDLEYIRRRDGSQSPVAIICTPRMEGGAVMVLRDISEWVESEDALRLAREEVELERQHMAHMERLSTTGEMASGIAHEVNQPLTAIVNYARVARRLMDAEELNREQLISVLDKLDTQSVRASDVVQRMRSFVKKPGQGHEECDPNTLIADVMVLAEIDSRINDVAIHFTPDDGRLSVYADPVQIQQVVLNLIRNAIEASAELRAKTGDSVANQSVIVTTRFEPSKVVISVIDTGVGVTAELADTIFNPFFSTKAEGMGIGLSICQSIVQSHGGELHFKNNPQGGACFYFTLPEC